jgi:hypothetical protein
VDCFRELCFSTVVEVVVGEGQLGFYWAETAGPNVHWVVCSELCLYRRLKEGGLLLRRDWGLWNSQRGRPGLGLLCVRVWTFEA